MKKLVGFTLAEVMISLTIIGVIMVFYVPVHKVVSAQYTTLAYSALENLSLISKEMMSGDVFVTVEGVKKSALAADSQNRLIINPETSAFCNAFADMINVSGSVNCASGEENYSDVTGSNPLEFKFGTKDWSSPNISSTNGQRYYFSKHQPVNSSVSSQYGYRVIAVDLTGKKSPNSEDHYPDSPSGKPDDIVYFLMIDDGSVYPIGIAATNRNYINTRTIAYYYTPENFPSGLDEKKAIGCHNFFSGNGIDDYHDIVFDPDAVEKPDLLNECNFLKDNLLSTDPNTDGEQTYSYRMAYCLQKGQTGDFQGYSCTGDFSQDAVCASGGAADECMIEPVKPVYKVKI